MTENEKQRQLEMNDDVYMNIIDKTRNSIKNTLSDILNNIDDIDSIDDFDDVLFTLEKLKSKIIEANEELDEVEEDEESIEKGIKVYYDDYEEEYMLEKRG